MKLIPIIVVWIFLAPSKGAAICASLIKGQIAIDINQCGFLSPEKTFPLTDPQYQFIADLSSEDRARFYNSYRGLLIRGKVQRSMAIKSGLSPKKGALSGEDIVAFVPPGISQCAKILNTRILTIVDEACCQGGGDPPCLLETTYVFKGLKILGKSKGVAGNIKREKLKTNPVFQKANSLLRQEEYQKAATIYHQLKQKGQLDIRGHYFLGFAYRRLDQCARTVTVLQPVYNAAESKKLWANDESVVRKSNLLLARCLAKLGKAGPAVIVLDYFLVESVKFNKEIRQALAHPDFGRIRTTKVYLDFEASARKLLIP